MNERIRIIVKRADARRDRRLRAVRTAQEGFPNAALWRSLDLVHEATYLIDRLERRQETHA